MTVQVAKLHLQQEFIKTPYDLLDMASFDQTLLCCVA